MKTVTKIPDCYGKPTSLCALNGMLLILTDQGDILRIDATPDGSPSRLLQVAFLVKE